MEAANSSPNPKQPEEIFPVVVWTLIFDKLDSPTDVATCFRTCSSWRKLLGSKRKFFLMPEVYPFLHQYLLMNKIEKNGEDVAVNGENSSRPGNPILNTRMICRSWKIGVDAFAQSSSHHTDLAFLPRTIQIYINRTLNPYNFSGLEPQNVEHFLSKGYDPSCNPFVTRRVEFLTCFGWHNLEEFEHLLETFGDHVWFAKLTFVFSLRLCFDAGILYNWFHRMLSLMPNLKSLIVLFDVITTRPPGTIIQFRKLMRIKPLPKLEHLTKLDMNGVPAPIEKGMLLAKTVKQLRIRSGVKGFPVSSAGIPDYLKKLEMPRLKELGLWANVNGESDLRALKSFPRPIKVLEVQCGNIKLDNVFRELSKAHFARKLKELLVSAKNKQCVFVNVKENLSLQQLNTLHLHLAAPLTSIDFLLPCRRTLVNLGVRLQSVQEPQQSPGTYCSVRKRIASQIQFFGYESSLEQSNIWNLFPKLQSIDITIPKRINGAITVISTIITRRHYNDFQQNKTQILPNK